MPAPTDAPADALSRRAVTTVQTIAIVSLLLAFGQAALATSIQIYGWQPAWPPAIVHNTAHFAEHPGYAILLTTTQLALLPAVLSRQPLSRQALIALGLSVLVIAISGFIMSWYCTSFRVQAACTLPPGYWFMLRANPQLNRAPS